MMRRLALLWASPLLLAVALLGRGAARASPPAEAFAVTIATPHGGQTSERVVTVRGTVAGYRGDRLTLVVNGIPMSVGVTNGSFEQPQVLGPGLNSIRAVASQDGITAEDQVALYAQVPAKDLRVTLTWDTGATDVDLWVTGPDGEKIMYSHREGVAGGILDTDVTTGFGPETYTQARLAKGTYRVQAHAFGISRPTRVQVTTVRFEGTPDEERQVFHAVLLRTGDVAEVGEFTSR